MIEEPHPFDIITSYIEDADKYGLVPEVVYFALKIMLVMKIIGCSLIVLFCLLSLGYLASDSLLQQ